MSKKSKRKRMQDQSSHRPDRQSEPLAKEPHATGEDDRRTHDQDQGRQNQPLPDPPAGGAVDEDWVAERQKPEEHEETNTETGKPKNALRIRICRWLKKECEKATLGGVLMVLFTAVVAGATVAYVIVAGNQLSIMSGQLEQMKSDSKSSSQATSNQLDAMNKQGTAMTEQVGVMKEQLKQMRDASRLEQRAWVGCRQPECTPMVVGKRFTIDLVYSNTGRTPANRVEITYYLSFLEKGDSDIESIVMASVMASNKRPKTEVASERTSAPDLTRRQPIDITLGDLTDEKLQRIKDGYIVVCFLGEIAYDDIFEERHKTTFCYVLYPSGWTLKTSQQYNRME